MRPDLAARILAVIGASLLILVAAMRLLSVYLLIGDARLQNTPTEAPGPEPALGMYAFSSDGQLVRFERGVFTEGVWTGDVYLLNLQDGSTTAGDLPAADSMYTIADGQVYLNQGSAGPRLLLSPIGVQVRSGAVSASGEALAFIDAQDPNRQRLYALRGLSPAELLMEAAAIHDVHWSPGDAALVFAASVGGEEDLYLFPFGDRTLRRLTNDGAPKASPRFSPDGEQIAFLSAENGAANGSVPEPVRSEAALDPFRDRLETGIDVYLIDANGANLRRLTETAQDETSLVWIPPGEVVFARWHPHWSLVSYLYAVDPVNGDERRLYPAVAIESFTCQPALPGGNRAEVQITITNDSAAEAAAPLEVSADRQPVDLLTSRSAFRVQRENITLQPGETRSITWEVNIPDDIRVYLAASIETGVEYPISASFCEITPRRLFLPRLPMLGPSLAVGAVGTLICLPWLRHNRKRAFWLLMAAFWGLLIGLMLLEGWIVISGGRA